MTIDMGTEDWRTHNFNRGDSWRSIKVYKCVVCETKTNYWVMGGWPGLGPRLICPYSHIDHDSPFYRIHEKIEAFQDRLEGDWFHPAALTKRERAEVEAEIADLRRKFRALNPRDNVVEGK